MWQTTCSQTSRLKLKAQLDVSPKYHLRFSFLPFCKHQMCLFYFQHFGSSEQIPSVGQLFAVAIWFLPTPSCWNCCYGHWCLPHCQQVASFWSASSLPVDSLGCWQPLPISVSYICYLTFFRLFSDLGALVFFLVMTPLHWSFSWASGLPMTSVATSLPECLLKTS